MKISAFLWCILYALRLVQSEKCISRYFKMLQGRRLQSTPVERVMVKSEILCAMRCVNEEWCQAINFINNGELQHCELFSETEVGTGQTINDEVSVYYYALKVEDDTNKTHEIATVSSTAHALTSMTLSSVPISPSSAVPLSMMSSVTSHSMPAVACKKIFQDNPASTDGKYTIFGGTENEAEVFCDMTGALTGCNGGGWTLVMRINGEQQTFGYGANYWTNKVEFQPTYGHTLDSNVNSETKLSTYHTTPFTQICLGMKHNNEKGWTTLNLASTSLFDLISSNTYHGTNLAVTEWKGLITSGAVLQQKCRIQGINAVRGDTGVRLGIIATKTCGVNDHYNSRLGFGAKGWSCGQDGNNRCGNDARCDQALSKKTLGYILVK